MRSVLTFVTAVLLMGNVAAQNGIIAGPMLGQVELRTASIWVEGGSDAKTVALKYWKKSDLKTVKTKNFLFNKEADFKPMQIEIGALEPNTTYEYSIIYNGLVTKTGGSFTTKELWQWRKSAPDFSFLAGSCAYFNEPVYDRPGKPYGGDSSIFNTMAKEKASFMLWLGDNWYTREADYFSEWGLWYRASKDRRLPILQNFWKAMPHYAIWDDHDYGPNDADKSYILKQQSRNVFKSYWANPSYGQNDEGIYTKMSYGDVDFFMMDDRYFRSADAMQPMIDGKPNADKKMWGDKQLSWLKSALLSSNAVFKIIVTGSQTLNPASPFDCLQHYPVEFNDLMQYLQNEKVNGVMLITGDRHHSEIIKYERAGTYSLYDITSSPLTSGIGKVSGNEKNNAAREPNTLVEEQNYARITVSGKPRQREFKVEFVDINGNVKTTWRIDETKLKTPVEQ
jgi:alkaline phosphatase D